MVEDTGERAPPAALPAAGEYWLHAAIVDACPAAIFAKDVQGRYILVNRHWEALFHVARDRVKGKTDYDFFPKENAGLFREHDRQVLEAGSAMIWEETVMVEDSPRVYTSLKFPIQDPSGKVGRSAGLPRTSRSGNMPRRRCTGRTRNWRRGSRSGQRNWSGPTRRCTRRSPGARKRSRSCNRARNTTGRSLKTPSTS